MSISNQNFVYISAYIFKVLLNSSYVALRQLHLSQVIRGCVGMPHIPKLCRADTVNRAAFFNAARLLLWLDSFGYKNDSLRMAV